jgi:ATP-dependent helicase Lhr and Lhr-like helicase
MGRTGRRLGRTRNCLFLATSNDSLIQAAGLIDLWAHGFVDPITAPPKPFHIVAQQLMALALQEKGLGRRDWCNWIKNGILLAALTARDVEHLIEYMLNNQILSEDQGILWLGAKGEDFYGYRNFMELLSVFTSPPLFLVLHGRQELGFVDEITFLGKTGCPRILLLGGRAWQVNHIDWQRRVAYVEATAAEGKSRWQGEGQALGYDLCQTIKKVLMKQCEREHWSRRARDRIEILREEFPWLESDSSTVVTDSTGQVKWWTFAGGYANATLANELGTMTRSRVQHDNFTVSFRSDVPFKEIESGIAALRSRDAAEMHPAVDEDSINGLKFFECVPHEVALESIRERMKDAQATVSVLRNPARFVGEGDSIS